MSQDERDIPGKQDTEEPEIQTLTVTYACLTCIEEGRPNPWTTLGMVTIDSTTGQMVQGEANGPCIRACADHHITERYGVEGPTPIFHNVFNIIRSGVTIGQVSIGAQNDRNVIYNGRVDVRD